MNTIALLVLANSAPKVLNEIARKFLRHPVKIYVHLDRKVTETEYQDGLEWPGNLEFLDERLEIYWGGFNMIRATIELAKTALADKENQVFALISDDTFLLVSPARVCSELLMRKNRIDVAQSKRNPPYLKRYTDFFYMDSLATSARPVDAYLRSVDVETLNALQRLAHLRAKGKFPLPDVWSGSQWWSLDRSLLSGFIGEIEGNEWLRESFEFSAIPDELLFQTLYANHEKLTWRSFTSPMHTDMARNPKPFVYSSVSQIGDIAPDKLFIRKIANEHAEAFSAEIESIWI